MSTDYETVWQDGPRSLSLPVGASPSQFPVTFVRQVVWLINQYVCTDDELSGADGRFHLEIVTVQFEGEVRSGIEAARPSPDDHAHRLFYHDAMAGTRPTYVLELPDDVRLKKWMAFLATELKKYEAVAVPELSIPWGADDSSASTNVSQSVVDTFLDCLQQEDGWVSRENALLFSELAYDASQLVAESGLLEQLVVSKQIMVRGTTDQREYRVFDPEMVAARTKLETTLQEAQELLERLVQAVADMKVYSQELTRLQDHISSLQRDLVHAETEHERFATALAEARTLLDEHDLHDVRQTCEVLQQQLADS